MRRRSGGGVKERSLSVGRTLPCIERRDGAQRARRIDVLQRDAGERLRLAHDRDETRGEQRMAAEIGEEIRIERDRLRRQHAFGGGKQRGLDLIARLFLRLGRGDRHELELFETVAIDFAGDERRQASEKLEARRHHIGRQFAAKLAAHKFLVDLGAGRRDQKGDEFVDPVMLAQNDGGVLDAGAFGELRFDLAEFDAEAADLHLIVDAAAKLQIAVRRR